MGREAHPEDRPARGTGQATSFTTDLDPADSSYPVLALLMQYKDRAETLNLEPKTKGYWEEWKEWAIHEAGDLAYDQQVLEDSFGVLP